MPEYIIDSEATRTPDDWCRANGSGMIVRCRDCEPPHRDENGSCLMLAALMSQGPYWLFGGDGYCAWGKRKEDR